jgi:hypothetical protein
VRGVAILQFNDAKVESRVLKEEPGMRSEIDWKGSTGLGIAMPIIVGLFIAAIRSNADDTSPSAPAVNGATTGLPNDKKAPAPPKLPEPKGAKRLSKEYPVWIDPQEKTVIVEGQVALREGMLEMFACTRNTKEHESIISANTKAYLVHAALLSLGAEAGHPVRFQPEFVPPAGTEIDVFIRYLDDKGKLQTARAQDWIKDIRTGKPMTYPFVFAGSSFYVDPDTKKQYYRAEQGEFVCVSNFGAAMLDIPVKSSKSNEQLEFEAITKKIPPLGAPVHLVFKPKLKKQGAGSRERGVGTKEPNENKTTNSAKNSAGKAK